MDRCDQCGYDYRQVDRPSLGAALEEAALEVTGALSGVDRLRERPGPEVWSALEYACHVRDVLEVQQSRIRRVLTEDRPTFEPMGREERVTRLDYNRQDPLRVHADLAANARSLVDLIDELADEEWDRTGFYNWPEPAERTVDWIVRHTIHELVHHRADIQVVGQGDRP